MALSRSRFSDDDEPLEELEDKSPEDIEDDEESLLEEEETLEELDVDDRGHVRPRRRRQDDEEIDPDY